MKKGIDVSHYQKKIDWAKAKKVVEFSILKIGEGRYSNQKDEYFERNYAECKRLGIPVGVYSYAYAQSVSEAKEEAKRVIEWLNNRSLDLPVYYDMENAKMEKLGKTQLTEIAIAFCREIENAGYWVGIYANLNWFTNCLDVEKLRKMFTLWIANVDYTHNQMKFEGQYDMFQYSWKGQVDGIIASVDMDIMYRDLVTDIKNSKVNNHQTNNSVEVPKDEPIYYTIKSGDTLSGIAQKFNTTVNELARLNNIQNVNLIYANNTIRIK